MRNNQKNWTQAPENRKHLIKIILKPDEFVYRPLRISFKESLTVIVQTKLKIYPEVPGITCTLKPYITVTIWAPSYKL